MHQLFTVSDVLAQICGVLLDEDDDRATVACLARTNRILSAPCLAVLWRKLDCLYPLLNALPSSVINLSARWRLLRYPTLQDWNRPLYYGAFVRSITYDPQRSGFYRGVIHDSHRSGVHRSFMYDLIASLRIRPGPGPSTGAIQLLPNLAHAAMTWRLAAPETFLAWNLFYSPTLLSASNVCEPDPLYAHEHQHRAILAEWFHALQSRCPLVEEIRSEPRWGAIMALHPTYNIQTTLPCFVNLRSLRVIVQGRYALRFIKVTAMQPRLKRLSIRFDPASVMPESLGDDAYPSLETLQIEGYSRICSEYLTLLAARPPPHLTHISVTGLSLEQPTAPFFAAIAHAAPHLGLRTLSLAFHPNYEPAARTTLLDLAPLFVFEELRELRIQAGNPFCLNSASLEIIGAAFPVLRILCLNSPNADDGDDSAGTVFTWAAIVALARTCPSLVELSLPLDFDSLASLSPVASPRSSMQLNGGSQSPLPLDEARTLSSQSHHLHAIHSLKSCSTASDEEIFLNLETFLLNDVPPSTLPPQPLSTPLSVLNLPPTSRSRSARNSLQNPQYAALALLVERVFPRAKLGLHVSQFDQHEGQERRERFESSWRKRRK